jgi:hypothetical protein
MPLVSKAQTRWAFATDQPFAEKWAHGGPKGYIKKLPSRIRSDKDRRKARRAIRGYRESALNILLNNGRLVG